MNTHKLLQHFSLAAFHSTPYFYATLAHMATHCNRTIFELSSEIVMAITQQLINSAITHNTAYVLIETLLLSLYENHTEEDIPDDLLNLFEILHTCELESTNPKTHLKQFLSEKGSAQ